MRYPFPRMIKVKSIDHVAIAVTDAAGSAVNFARLFDLVADPLEHVATQKTDVVSLHLAGGGGDIEFVSPAGNDGLARFLDKRGPGIHHLCLEVEDLALALITLKNAGVPLVDEQPRRGGRGRLVGFLHPKATGGVLIELSQKLEGESC